MKILYLISSMGRGGREQQLMELIRGLRSRAEIGLIVFNEEVAHELNALGVKLLLVRKDQRRRFSMHRAVISFIRKFSPDVIHYWDALSCVYALEARLFLRYRLVDGSIRYAGKISRSVLEKTWKNIRFALADRIIANSAAGLQVESLTRKKKAIVVHNGISLERFLPDPAFDPSRVFTGGDKIRVVMVAGLRPAKDFQTLIRAAESLCVKFDRLQFLFVGDGESRQATEDGIKPEMKERIEFLGNRKDVEQVLLHCDIGVLLNNTDGHAEGLSNSIMEYMAAGLPVVATLAGGTPELVIEGETGFLVSSWDVEQVSDRLSRLIENDELRKQFGQAGRARISTHFSLEGMTNACFSIYEQLMSPGKKLGQG